ncbi:MAG: glycosyltransferase family 2 protein [Burkholderiales bacterium]|nr:glycosyltransferase family 2 protein [Burkholderiales bacterium]MCZ2135894.1 glycosyltransferase family 2 protein [Burkholderiales bacterium]
MRATISAVVLCHNEAVNIRHCLESVAPWMDVFVVDSGSTDGTQEVVRGYTPHLFEHPYSSHAAQWAWALDHLPITTDWVLALDADFVLTPALRAEIEGKLASIDAGVAGVYVRHRYVFGGGPIRFGGTKQFWLRIIRRGRARPDQSDLVDFRFTVDGSVARFSGAVIEYNRHDDDISVWTRKQDKFSLRLAVEEELRRRRLLGWEGKPSLLGTPDERFMRLRDLWLNSPLFVRPVLYFFYRYVLMLGLLDGRAGFLYHVLQGFWLRLMVDWKIMQIRGAALSDGELDTLRQRMFETRDGGVEPLLRAVRIAATDAGAQR